jgi:unsaturated chondroitin disaccharide hydrolase
MKRRSLITGLSLALLLSGLPPTGAAFAQSPNPEYQRAFAFIQKQLTKMSEMAGGGYADYTHQGKWRFADASNWTAGMMPGMMWKVYHQTKDPGWLARAERWTAPIAAHRHDEIDLDFGFLYMPTFVAGYQLTGKQPHRAVALDAAAAFARRYMPEGKYLRSWGKVGDPREQEFIIIDFIMNLNLMFWAAREERNPLLFEMAYNTAVVTMNTAVRPDGSSLQVIELDPLTGKKRRDRHKQGFSVASCWARGQAFGIYGFTETYQNTKDYRFLETAMKMADYYIAHSPPDHVPYWDFQAPNIPNEPRDSSAAAIAASGMWELSKTVVDPAQKKRYAEMAVKILDSLTRNYLATGEAIEQGRILMHATVHKPAKVGVDESMSLGDYYYLEALQKIALNP